MNVMTAAQVSNASPNNALLSALLRVDEFQGVNDSGSASLCSSEYSDSVYVDCPGE